jgi:hypothetical protein
VEEACTYEKLQYYQQGTHEAIYADFYEIPAIFTLNVPALMALFDEIIGPGEEWRRLLRIFLNNSPESTCK